MNEIVDKNADLLKSEKAGGLLYLYSGNIGDPGHIMIDVPSKVNCFFFKENGKIRHCAFTNPASSEKTGKATVLMRIAVPITIRSWQFEETLPENIKQIVEESFRQFNRDQIALNLKETREAKERASQPPPKKGIFARLFS